MNITATSPRQMRAARMLLGWSQSDLAKHSRVSVTVIARLEKGAVDARLSTIMAILDAFEEQGIRFVDGSAGMGVIHRPQTRVNSTEDPSPEMEV